MAASVKMNNSARMKSILVPSHISTKDHPLHLFISREDASRLNVPREKTTFYLSVWTNTTFKPTIENESRTERPPTFKKSSIFQRMLSGSQNFPEILQPDSTDVDTEQKDDSLIGSDVEVFAYVWVKNIPNTSSDNVCLYCTEEFKNHYNIDCSVVYVRQVIAYPISSVTIGVGSHETFQWLSNSKFPERLLTEVNKNTVLIRSKDVFLAPYGNFLEDPDFKRSFYSDMFALECAPVQQGLITDSTEMVLTYMGDLVAERQVFHAKMASILASPDKDKKSITGPFKDTLMSDFSRAMNQVLNTPEINEDRKSLSFKMKADAMQVRRDQAKNNIVGQYFYEIVPQQSKFKRMLWRDNRKQTFDPLYYVGMSRKLMIKLGLFHSSYVLISPVYYDDEDESIDEPKQRVERLCMIKCLGKEFDKSKRLFISPLCLFNMIRKPPVEFPQYLLMRRYSEMGDHNYNITSSQSWNAEIPEAKEVHISIIPSPNYSPRSPHDESLKQYFSVPRIVAVGDVIAIRSSDDPQFWQNTGDDTENRFPCIYFKVVRATGPPSSHGNFILNKDTTKLLQIGTDHSYIPVMMQVYLNPTPQGFWDRDVLPGLSGYVDQLESFILPHLTSKHGCKSLNTVPPAILVAGPAGCGKTTLIIGVARRLGVHAFKINCHALVGESSGATEARMKNAFTAAGLYSPCILLLQSIHAIGKDRDGSSDDPRVASSFLANVLQLKNDLQQYPMIVVATCHSNRDLTHDMLECFLHQVCIEVPTELERADMFDAILQNVAYSGNVSVSYIAQRTAGFVLGDMAALVAHAKREAFRRVLKLCCEKRLRPTPQEEEDLLASGIVLQQVDFQTALDQLQAAHSDAIGAPKIPNVTWDDVGGLIDVKSEILDTIQLPLQYPELLAAGLRRSGVLLYGPPGTGKTLLAKAVATECSLNFLSVKGPELINMYVGQSEENVREVFRRARSATPCVIFFDELDSLAPNRGRSGDSGGVMDRVVSQLLAELDGLNKASDVFVIGATNRPDLLDPALLRPGRFDKLLYLGVSEDNDSQMRILSALTRKFNLGEDFQLESVIEKCPFTLTGADFYALSSDAMLNAVKRKIQELETDPTAEQSIMVTEQDFFDALDKLTPSVSEEELYRYRSMQKQYEVTDKQKPKIQTSV